MNARLKTLTTTLVVGSIAFLATPIGPLGGFWAPAAGGPEPTTIQLVLFVVLLAIESLAFGLGTSLLLYGYPRVAALMPGGNGLARLAHLAITWLLVNWWAHDSLHIHTEHADLNGTLLIEYGFHFTLIVSGLILAYFFVRLLRLPPAQPRGL